MKTRKECGLARAASLSPERRSEIAKKAIAARWMPKATHQGILKILDKELPCVVLDDGRRIINQSSLFLAFDRGRKGRRYKENEKINLPSILDPKNLREFITDEIISMAQPINYLNVNLTNGSGYSAEIIPIVCKIYISARKNNTLTPNQMRTADISELLLDSLSRIGIIGLIDEATGYQIVRPRDALESYLNKILSKELAAWCKRFPDEYYQNIYKIRKWPEFSTSKNKYSCVGTYTNDIVYSRLGKEILDELKSRTPDTSKSKLHQWLSVDTGHPLLSTHINSILTIQKLAIAQGFGWKRFMEMVDLIHPKKELEFIS